MKFPFTLIDNFYDNPHEIRNFALNLNYQRTSPLIFPALRSDLIHEIDKNFFDKCCQKFFSLFYDLNYSGVEWVVQSEFQKIYKFSKNKKSPLNQGWIHCDLDKNKNGSLLTGVVYLNPSPAVDSGTTLYDIKKDGRIEKESCLNEWHKYNKCFYNLSSLPVEENAFKSERQYKNTLVNHNSKFEKTIEVKNLYNRLVIFDGSIYHATTNSWMDDEDFRLAQVFFVRSLNGDTTPLERCKQYEVPTL